LIARTARQFPLVIALVVVLALAPIAFAGKGGGGGKPGGGGSGGGSGSLSLVMVTDQNGNGAPNWGDTVTFNIQQTATTSPYVDLTCAQNGAVVYSTSSGFFAAYPWPWTKDMTLGSQAWTGGAASCTARLYYFSSTKSVTLATLSFTAAA
jgi:hypothetical protein